MIFNCLQNKPFGFGDSIIRLYRYWELTNTPQAYCGYTFAFANFIEQAIILYLINTMANIRKYLRMTNYD